MQDLTKWFEAISRNQVKPSLVYLVGDTGTGKKTYVQETIKTYDYRCIHINCLYDKDHSRLKKKTFLSQLTHIVTNKNIEYFLTGIRDVVVIHNLHVINDKSFYDDILKLKDQVDFVTPVICILNRSHISERFLSYMTKGCEVFDFPKKTPEELVRIANCVGPSLGLTNPHPRLQECIQRCDGNIYHLLTQMREYALTGKNRVRVGHTCRIDKNIVTKCFDDLCSIKEKWTHKQDLVKAQGSLIRLLMPSHVFLGLDDEEDSRSMAEKHRVATDCIGCLAIGENVKHSTSFASLIQCIYPTSLVRNTSIKSMVLTNCQSSTNLCNLPKLLYPYPDDQYIHIVYYLIEAIELEQQRKKHVDETNWGQWLPELSKVGFNELQQKHFKLFSDYNITKKKINRFITRMNGAIPEKIDT